MRCAWLRLHVQPHRHAFKRAPRQQPAKVLKGPDCLHVVRTECSALHQLSTPQARTLRNRARYGAGQQGLGLFHPIPVDQRIQQYGEQQVGDRPSRHNGSPRTQGLGIES
ncbi:hypothetical protein D3C71_1812770 [compost metagenome]